MCASLPSGRPSPSGIPTDKSKGVFGCNPYWFATPHCLKHFHKLRVLRTAGDGVETDLTHPSPGFAKLVFFQGVSEDNSEDYGWINGQAVDGEPCEDGSRYFKSTLDCPYPRLPPVVGPCRLEIAEIAMFRLELLTDGGEYLGFYQAGYFEPLEIDIAGLS